MHGEWLSAVVAVVVGQFVVGVWAWATGCGPVVGTTVGAALATGMAAAFVVSQWPRDGLLRPPAQDHLVVGCALSLVAVVALLVEGVAAGVLRAGWVILVTVLVLVPFGCCVRYTLILEEGLQRLAVHGARPGDLRCRRGSGWPGPTTAPPAAAAAAPGAAGSVVVFIDNH